MSFFFGESIEHLSGQIEFIFLSGFESIHSEKEIPHFDIHTLGILLHSFIVLFLLFSRQLTTSDVTILYFLGQLCEDIDTS